MVHGVSLDAVSCEWSGGYFLIGLAASDYTAWFVCSELQALSPFVSSSYSLYLSISQLFLRTQFWGLGVERCIFIFVAVHTKEGQKGKTDI